MKQETFTDIEYSYRKKKTKREEFLEIMDEIIPWEEWVGVIEPYYPKGKRGRPPMGIEKMLRMYLLQIWFNLSDPATEDAIYDSYAMRKFTGIEFMTESVPDETTLCKFRHLLEANGLNKLFFDAINRVMVATGHMMKGGTTLGATGENAVVYNSTRVDAICGPIGILMANAMLGEISPKMAGAISNAEVPVFLIPMGKCNAKVAGVAEKKLADYVKEVVGSLEKLKK